MTKLAKERWRGSLRVEEIVVETPTMKTFRFVNPSGGNIPFTFIPGQFVNIDFHLQGQSVKRAFTIASSPTRKQFIDITVKKEENGFTSVYFCDDVKVGDELTMEGPLGKFCFTGAEASSIVLIGGGVGVTPLITVVRYLVDIKWPGEIFNVYAYKNQEEYLYRQELEELAKNHDNFKLFVWLTREPESSDWQGFRGRFDKDDVLKVIDDFTSRRVHICGPMQMIKHFRDTCKELGMSKEQIQFESFGAPKKKS